MSQQNHPFPTPTDAESAQTAATLAVAACALMASGSGDSQEYALHRSRMVFAEQFQFLRAGKWEEKTDRFLMSRGMDLS